MLHLLTGNARAGVAHTVQNTAVLTGKANVDGAGFVGELDRVVQQIVDHLPDQIKVGVHLGVIAILQPGNGDVLVLQPLFKQQQSGAGRFHQVEGHAVDPQLTGIDAGQIHHRPAATGVSPRPK